MRAWGTDRGVVGQSPLALEGATSLDPVLFLQLYRITIFDLIVRQLNKNTQFPHALLHAYEYGLFS